MNYEHAAHGSAGVVKYPFSGVLEIRCKVSFRVIFDQLVNECLEQYGGVCRGVGVRGRCDRQRFLHRGIQTFGCERVEAGLERFSGRQNERRPRGTGGSR